MDNDRHPVVVGSAEYPPQLLDVQGIVVVDARIPDMQKPINRSGYRAI
jgi:hypothetical protein